MQTNISVEHRLRMIKHLEGIMMTEEQRGHIRHITYIARAARRDLRIAGTLTTEINRAIKALEEIENSARHALAASLPPFDNKQDAAEAMDNGRNIGGKSYHRER